MEGLTGKYCFQNIENGGNVENLFEHGWHRLHGYEERKPLTEFERELKKYIWWYNNKRIKLRLKGMSPALYRAHYYREINN